MNFFEATVRVLSHKGHGVVDHPDGRMFFAKGVWVGETARFRLTGTEKNYDVISVLEIISPSPHRVSAPCAHHGSEKCGGCPWMFISYEEQVQAKEKRIDFLLSKNNIPVEKRFSLIASDKNLGYRNRAQFKTDGVSIGFVTEGTNDLYAIEDCLVLNPQMREHLKVLRSHLPRADWSSTGTHPWNYIEMDDHQAVSDIQLNRRRPFRQGNSEQNIKMKMWIEEVLKDAPKEHPVIEAFCGSGNLTEAISNIGFTNILAAEVRGVAIDELRSKKMPGVQIMEIDMNIKGVWQQLSRRQPQAKILLVDPPREGLEMRAGLFNSLKQLEKVLYISCEPNTWARDVKDFQANGWKVESLTPIDLFPHTPHIELMSVLKLR